MTYLPSDLINSSFKYQINNDYFRVITNNNCFTQYGTTYCDCINVYPKLDYIRSESTSCSTSISNYVDSSHFSNDLYYRVDFVNILIIFIIIWFFVIALPYKIMSRAFGRWLRI